jgi:hypothetical protein
MFKKTLLIVYGGRNRGKTTLIAKLRRDFDVVHDDFIITNPNLDVLKKEMKQGLSIIVEINYIHTHFTLERTCFFSGYRFHMMTLREPCSDYRKRIFPYFRHLMTWRQFEKRHARETRNYGAMSTLDYFPMKWFIFFMLNKK